MLDKEIEPEESGNQKEEEIASGNRNLLTRDRGFRPQTNTFCCDFLEPAQYCQEADLKAKQQILGSILSEKLVFDEIHIEP
jgi:hypothetical protein